MLALIVAFALQLAQAATDPKPTAAETRLFQKITALKSEILAAPTHEGKLKALASLKEWLAKDARKITERDRAAQRRIRLTVGALNVYLEPLREAELSGPHCSQLRDQIYTSIDPKKSPPPYIPGEASEALEILNSICQ